MQLASNPTQALQGHDNHTELNLGQTPFWLEHWQKEQRVRRCGSGNIAIAAFLYHRVNKRTYQQNLNSPFGSITVGYDSRGPFYLDTPLVQSSIQHQALWRHLTGCHIHTGVYVGGPAEYCIVVYPSLYHLKSTQPKLAQFSLYTQRALIAAYLEPNLAHMRYFAPQYGQAEDTATGSASVQLAEFHYRQYGRREIKIQQHSREGGIIQSQKTATNQIKVRGQYQLLAP
ncbi:PhzF family phenazine biosynthesis protein [Gilvimarinus chinensis]|uniref:PhzF family phenazine biosynthesis protein n=1 Tax=Gilvimarinus chinensis TaxID=396005 RepID=UPI00036D56E4|nr:PhzF family phenazine biosynthesis protein [Gilvimarinus chinensis]